MNLSPHQDWGAAPLYCLPTALWFRFSQVIFNAAGVSLTLIIVSQDFDFLFSMWIANCPRIIYWKVHFFSFCPLLWNTGSVINQTPIYVCVCFWTLENGLDFHHPGEGKQQVEPSDFCNFLCPANQDLPSSFSTSFSPASHSSKSIIPSLSGPLAHQVRGFLP